MNDGIPHIKRGNTVQPQITSKSINDLAAAVKRFRVTPGPNTLMHQGPGGTQVWNKTPQRSLARATISPWAVRNVSASSELRISVYPGFVNGEAPVISGTSILDTPPPYLVLTVTCSISIKATVDTSDNITTYELVATSSIPISTYTPGSGGIAYARIATVGISSGIITSISQRTFSNLFLGVGHGYVWTSV